MKKVLLLLLLLPIMAGANDKTLKYVDTTVAADTAAQAINVDTLYSEVERVQSSNRFQWYYRIKPYVAHLNWTADTFYVYWQHSFDQDIWRNILIAKSIDTATVWSTANISVADSVIGNWGRYMVIHRDSAEADRPDSLGIIRGAEIELWMSQIK